MMKEIDFKYCPKCGGNFKKESEDYLSCEQCDLKYYINPKPCNAVILKNNEEKILFVKRKHDPQKGFWDLPGGFASVNETFEESVQREIKEELDITISDFRYIGSTYDMYDYGGITAYTICVLFEGTIPDNSKITPSDDAESIELFSPKDIPLEKIAFENQRNFLKKYFSL